MWYTTQVYPVEEDVEVLPALYEVFRARGEG
jgi:hypothetical protein